MPWRASLQRRGSDKTIVVEGMDLALLEGDLLKRNDVYFDRVALLNEGRLLAFATPTDMQQELAGRVYAVDVEPLREARDWLQPAAEVERAAVFGNRLHVTMTGPGGASAITNALADERFAVGNVTPIDASMEDVFIHQIIRAGEA